MDQDIADKLRALISDRTVAALGTLHGGAPYVSMVPFALLPDASAFVIHVSTLAGHTRDMSEDSRVSLLIMAADAPGVPTQALPRITVLGHAMQVAKDSPLLPLARHAYLSRFPDSAPIFDFGDFSLFTITPTTIRWIAGFGQAHTLSPEAFAEIVNSVR